MNKRHNQICSFGIHTMKKIKTINEKKNLFKKAMKHSKYNCVFLVASAILKIPNNFWPNKIETPKIPFGSKIFITYLA